VAVDLDNLLDRAGLQQRRCDALLDTQDHTFACCNTDGCGTKLDGLERVFDLEEAAFWREGVDATIILAACYELCLLVKAELRRGSWEGIPYSR
jgi:hypothetical protein